MIAIGVDPGARSAAVALAPGGGVLAAEVFKAAERGMLERLRWLRQWTPGSLVVVEGQFMPRHTQAASENQIRTRNSVSTASGKVSASRGRWEAVAELAGHRVANVFPVTWQAFHGLQGIRDTRAARAKRLAIRMHGLEFSDPDLCAALLIAEWARIKEI